MGVDRRDLIGFEACHIWPLTCYDHRYHTLIANLVLLPRALAGLTDHDSGVRSALQYRAFELYGWHPTELPAPVRPADYPSEWREPMPFSDAVARALTKRTGKGLALVTHPSATGAPKTPITARDYTRFDIRVGDESFVALPKRVAMLVVVRGLVGAGIAPSDIAAVVPSLESRLFRSAHGQLGSGAFVAAIQEQRSAKGKRFDQIRYFCDDNELIVFGNRTYALTNQWGAWTQGTLDTLLRTFPDRGVSASPAS